MQGKTFQGTESRGMVPGSNRKMDEYIGKYVESEDERVGDDEPECKQARPTVAAQDLCCEGWPAQSSGLKRRGQDMEEFEHDYHDLEIMISNVEMGNLAANDAAGDLDVEDMD